MLSLTIQMNITKDSPMVEPIQRSVLACFRGFPGARLSSAENFLDCSFHGSYSLLFNVRAIMITSSFTRAVYIFDLRSNALIGRIREMDGHSNQKIGSPALTDQSEGVHISGFESWSAENIGGTAICIRGCIARAALQPNALNAL